MIKNYGSLKEYIMWRETWNKSFIFLNKLMYVNELQY